MSKINLQEPQCNRNTTANFVNLIITSAVTQCLSSAMILSDSDVFYCRATRHSRIPPTVRSGSSGSQRAECRAARHLGKNGYSTGSY